MNNAMVSFKYSNLNIQLSLTCSGLFNIRNLVSSLILMFFCVILFFSHLIWEEMEAIKKILRLENMLKYAYKLYAYKKRVSAW